MASGTKKLLPIKNATAIYDRETKRLYLWATGDYAKPSLTSLPRDEHFVGGLKYTFEGFYVTDAAVAATPQPNEFADVTRDLDLTEGHFHPEGVIIKHAGDQQGTAPVEGFYKISYLPAYQG